MTQQKLNSKTMSLNKKNGVPFLTFNKLTEIPFITHGFSTKHGGVSKGEFSTMNLAFNRGDNPLHVTENYKRLANAIGVSFDDMVASAQDHNTVVRVVTEKEKGIGITRPRDLESVDALVTNTKNVVLVTYYADCTPMFFVDTKKRVIALAHGGWRGTAACIAQKVVFSMQNNFNTNPKDLQVCIGPAIAACCYEVDEECFSAFKQLKGVSVENIAAEKGNGKYMLNLPQVNKQILTYTGVPCENITVSDVCTQCNSSLLWSHRATNGKRGTMAAVMSIT